MTVTQAIERVRTRAEEVANTNREVLRFSEAASPGDNLRQGDIYIFLLNGLPKTAKPRPVNLQLAEGETQGSRHILDSDKHVEMFDAPAPEGWADHLVGPVMRLKSERTITHPEHNHITLASGVYRVFYQRSLDREEREIRARD